MILRYRKKWWFEIASIWDMVVKLYNVLTGEYSLRHITHFVKDNQCYYCYNSHNKQSQITSAIIVTTAITNSHR
jgi:hypothetical protein